MVALKYKDPADGLYKLVPVGLNTSSADARYVNVNGDTLTGNLFVGPAPAAGTAGAVMYANGRVVVHADGDYVPRVSVTDADGDGVSITLYGGKLVLRDTTSASGLTSNVSTLEVGTPTAAGHAATKAYVDGYTTTIGDGSALSYTVTHNLNTQNCHVTVRQTATPFERIDCVVRFATVNTVTVVLLTAPAAGAYTVTVSR